MPHRPFDDDAIEGLLRGTTPSEGFDALSSFISDVRAAAEAVPTPSPALAAAMAAGVSTDQGDLPATAASNVNGPATQAAGLPKWRNAKLKIQGFLASLGIAGKIALGAGVAVACTTGAGVAGVLPDPVQHAVARAVDAVTPFEIHDPSDAVTDPPTTDNNESDASDGDHSGGVVTPTTEQRETSPTTEAHESTPTTEAHDGSGDGSGDSTPTTEASDGGGDHESTPTTEASGGGGDGGGDGGDGDSTTTTTVPHIEQSITVTCSQVEAHVSCSFTAVDGDGVSYQFRRVAASDGAVSGDWTTPTGLSFDDTPPASGEYHYYVKATKNGSAFAYGVATITFTA
ncbi:MAG TPA: hypothetical protein VFR41_01845 [Acidimicrobiia bacterium]|nr:hypothetical protein [Acidimicrobiia bacterium]